MVEMVDTEIGRVFNALEKTGLIKTTAIMWSADHGERLTQHVLTSKMFLYDEAARVPLWRWSGMTVGEGADATGSTSCLELTLPLRYARLQGST